MARLSLSHAAALLPLLALCSQAAPAPEPMVMSMVHLTVFVKHQRQLVSRLEEIFHAVSDPASDRYGQHLSHVEASRFQEPTAADVATVNRSVMPGRAHCAAVGVGVGVCGKVIERFFTVLDIVLVHQLWPPSVWRTLTLSVLLPCRRVAAAACC